MPYLTPKLEFSPDPLSDTTPAYQDVTGYLIDASWTSGTARDLDQPQAGQAVFVLKNKNRDFEPEYAGGRFAGNIVPLRRFRWSITADGVSYPQGTWYATSYAVSYPDRSRRRRRPRRLTAHGPPLGRPWRARGAAAAWRAAASFAKCVLHMADRAHDDGGGRTLARVQEEA
jgi:hypothetical protein